MCFLFMRSDHAGGSKDRPALAEKSRFHGSTEAVAARIDERISGCEPVLIEREPRSLSKPPRPGTSSCVPEQNSRCGELIDEPDYGTCARASLGSSPPVPIARVIRKRFSGAARSTSPRPQRRAEAAI